MAKDTADEKEKEQPKEEAKKVTSKHSADCPYLNQPNFVPNPDDSRICGACGRRIH